MLKVKQVLPEKKQMQLEGLYLDQKLMDLSADIGRRVVFADFSTDKNGVVAKVDKTGHLQIPRELKNLYDWGLFQELMAQANVIICGGAYLKSLAVLGHYAQDILFQFEPGRGFEKLGLWRLRAGYKKRSPDLAVITQELEFEIPEELVRSGRKIAIFTTDAMANSDKARALNKANTCVIGCGETGVEGKRMIANLANDMGYRLIMMASGPRLLKLLLDSNCLDLLYITQAQMEISFDEPAKVRKILSGGEKINDLKGFSLSHQYIQENVITEDASLITQFFLRYDRIAHFGMS